MTSPTVTRGSISALALFVVLGCGSGAVPTTQPATPDPATPGPATPAGGPATAEGLCGDIPAVLAVSALGGPVDEPSGGEVVPRPNGIYCRYSLTGDANTNVEAQLKDMTREDFDALASTLGATTALPGVGEVAFSRSTSIMGVPGAAVAAWSGGRGVTVSINRAGDQSQMLASAAAIAAAVLLAHP